MFWSREIILLEMVTGTPHFNLKTYQKSREASEETMFKATGVRLVNDEIVISSSAPMPRGRQGGRAKSQWKNRHSDDRCSCVMGLDTFCGDCATAGDAGREVAPAQETDNDVFDPNAPPRPEKSAANWEKIKQQWQPDEPKELTDKERTAENWAEMQRMWVACTRRIAYITQSITRDVRHVLGLRQRKPTTCRTN